MQGNNNDKINLINSMERQMSFKPLKTRKKCMNITL